jgi:hypothetical protein
MGPAIVETLPFYVSFCVLVVFIDVALIMVITGKKHVKTSITVLSSLVTGTLFVDIFGSKSVELSFAFFIAGLIFGYSLSFLIRPVATGIVLGFQGYLAATLSANIFPVHLTAAIVLFSYGFLLTEVAPSFISILVSSTILYVSGVWIGIDPVISIFFVCAVSGARATVTVFESKIVSKFRRH